MRISFVVRTGCGTVVSGGFTDEVGFASRAPQQRSGYTVVRYDSQLFQLFGGIRTPHFICLNNPL